MTRDDLVRLGRGALVSRAAALLRSRHPRTNFDPGLFDRVSVQANRRTVVVSFAQSVTFEPLLQKSPTVRWVTVDLVEDLVASDADDGHLTIFVHTPATRAAVDFVLAALRKDATFAGVLSELGRGDVGVRITERESEFRAELGGRAFGLAVTVAKGTGLLSDRVEERLLEPAPVEEDPLEELKP